MTAPGLDIPGIEIRKPPEGVELRILTLEVDEELEAKGEGLEKGKGRAVISRVGVVDSYGDVIEAGRLHEGGGTDLLPNHSVGTRLTRPSARSLQCRRRAWKRSSAAGP